MTWILEVVARCLNSKEREVFDENRFRGKNQLRDQRIHSIRLGE